MLALSFISLSEKWKLARSSFIFMRPKWHALVQEDAAKLRGCQFYDLTTKKKEKK